MSQVREDRGERRSQLDVRADFPALTQDVNGQPLVYLDSAASAQQPTTVIDAVAHYHQYDHANVHRGVHALSARATEAYEGARDKLQSFINAANRSEIILTSGTTESINLVAQSFCRPRIGPGDKILITQLEHHSNIVPWQLVCEQTGAELLFAPIDETGQLNLDVLRALMTDDVVLLAIGHVSNALGTVNPVKEIIGWAATAASASPLKEALGPGTQAYVWPHEHGDLQGLAVAPLTPGVVHAAPQHPRFHEYMALVDALRVGRARERAQAQAILADRLG